MGDPNPENSPGCIKSNEQAQADLNNLLHNYCASSGEPAPSLCRHFSTESGPSMRVRLAEEEKAAKEAKAARGNELKSQQTRNGKSNTSKGSVGHDGNATQSNAAVKLQQTNAESSQGPRRSPREKKVSKRRYDAFLDSELDTTPTKKSRRMVTPEPTKRKFLLKLKGKASSTDESSPSPAAKRPKIASKINSVDSDSTYKPEVPHPTSVPDVAAVEPVTPIAQRARSEASGDDESELAADRPLSAVKGTGLGHAAEKPADAPNDASWNCANRNCNSGQTFFVRDGPSSYGRKVISNFFGRNKRETANVDPDVWHTYCRKDYQRAKYKADNGTFVDRCEYHVGNIETQLIRMRLWRPEAKFEVKLTVGGEKRVGEYHTLLCTDGITAEQAAQSMHRTPTTNRKNRPVPLSLEDAFPIELLSQFRMNFIGKDKDYTDLANILIWVRRLFHTGSVVSMPPMEFLINAPTEGETIIDPTTNYLRWLAYEDGKEYNGSSSSSSHRGGGSGSDADQSSIGSADSATSTDQSTDHIPAGNGPRQNSAGNHNDGAGQERMLTPADGQRWVDALRAFMNGAEIFYLGDGSINYLRTLLGQAAKQADRQGWPGN